MEVQDVVCSSFSRKRRHWWRHADLLIYLADPLSNPVLQRFLRTPKLVLGNLNTEKGIRVLDGGLYADRKCTMTSKTQLSNITSSTLAPSQPASLLLTLAINDATVMIHRLDVTRHYGVSWLRD